MSEHRGSPANRRTVLADDGTRGAGGNRLRSVTRSLPGPLRNIATEVGGPLVLAGQTIRTAVREPRGYWGDVRDDTYDLLKKTIVPGIFAMLGYGMLLAVFAVSIFLILGAPNRLGPIYVAILIREIAPFIAGSVVAGVVGTATTTEIGARKIREELDALRVLGQDPVRMLVLPRVIGLAIVTWVVNIIGILTIVVQGYFVATLLGGTSQAAYLTEFMMNISVPEIFANAVKMILIGLIIGFVCASKGLRATSGAEGLGRAVNQAIVISVLAVFIVSVLFNMVLLATVPEMTVSR
nr:ABC transporter permease [Haloechinothrix aidingensis]